MTERCLQSAFPSPGPPSPRTQSAWSAAGAKQSVSVLLYHLITLEYIYFSYISDIIFQPMTRYMASVSEQPSSL